MQEERWLLPAGIEEVLPPQARVIEGLRRDLLDLYQSWGYELVMPPFIDFLESLLTGTLDECEAAAVAYAAAVVDVAATPKR